MSLKTDLIGRLLRLEDNEVKRLYDQAQSESLEKIRYQRGVLTGIRLAITAIEKVGTEDES